MSDKNDTPSAGIMLINRQRDRKYLGEFDYEGAKVAVVLGSRDDERVPLSDEVSASRDVAVGRPVKLSECPDGRLRGVCFSPEIKIPRGLWGVIKKSPAFEAIRGFEASGAIRITSAAAAY